MDLYVKSEKIDARLKYTIPHRGHWCTAGYMSQGWEKYLFPEDKNALEFLEQKRVSFNLIDLSECSIMKRLQAKLSRINKTPTLILDDGTKLKAIEQIKNHF